MAKIGVITDSAAYLTDEQVKKYNIDVIPISLIWDNKVYHDMIDIGYHEFYQRLASQKSLPTTSQPSIGEIQAHIDKFIDEGYTDLIIIPLSSGISSTYSNITTIAKNEDRIKIHAFDSKVTCAGQADLVILAARLIQAGASLDLIIHDLSDLRKTIGVRFMVDDLKHLKRTGRLSNAASFVGSLLHIKPILTMDVQKEGKIIASGKERQYKRAVKRIQTDFAQIINQLPYPVQLTIFDADSDQRAREWNENYTSAFPEVKINHSIIGPVVGVHVGQDTIAIIWCRDLDSYFTSDGTPLAADQINSPSL
ncbi:DegV family protein [Lactobacillus sp. PV034]|uniref:DegV family protein n=1 Tax=Lactobacillus sp. PV034 TaxID=2594495 RepID=UPI00223F4754|nr:DegV family protein [Lactobacillus sp. PV034]QNQ80417.1 DegV family protein [Lactobacillus sp. PV034]